MKINGIRFIIGTSCNYDCFYCHHEGCKDLDTKCDINEYKMKIEKIAQFCKQNGIRDIAITGGEPFLYIEKLKTILNAFKDDFKIVINTNASLIEKYIDIIKEYEGLEFHINLSSLKENVHMTVVNRPVLEQELKALSVLKNLNHIVKLNIICLKTINDGELIDLYNYAKSNGFIPRFLVFWDSNGEYKEYFMSVQDICSKLKNKVTRTHSYGIIDTTGECGDVEIVKCLCIDNECEKCKENTYMHISPELNIKYCSQNDETVEIDYSTGESIYKSFEIADKKLRGI